MTRTALRALAVVLLAAALVWAAAPWLQSLGGKPKPASPPPEVPRSEAPVTTAPTPPSPEPWDEQRLTGWVAESPAALLMLWAPRVLCLVLGVFFLVQELLRPERIRHGLLPPPDGLGPTVVASPVGAVALAVLFPLGVQVAAQLLFRPRSGDLRFGVLTAVAAFLPPALLVVLRRARLGAGRVPRAPAGLGDGLRFLCIAILVTFPLTLLWALALQGRGVTLHVQDTVQRFAEPHAADDPWLIAVFGAVVAPFTEEAVFRGLLYPSLRGRVPGGPFAAAVVVGLLFSAIHGNLLAFVPLFALALVLCWVMERTNSLLACVVVHVLHNSLSLLPLLWRHVEDVTT